MLNDEQKETVRAWATEGADLAQIHQRIRDDLGVAMTYFDARMLVSELEVSLDKPEEEKEESALEEEPQAEEQDSSASTLVDEREAPMREPEPAQGGGSVSVTVDTIALPQSMVSGKVGGRPRFGTKQMQCNRGIVFFFFRVNVRSPL